LAGAIPHLALFIIDDHPCIITGLFISSKILNYAGKPGVFQEG
jgi:hypothetical protein